MHPRADGTTTEEGPNRTPGAGGQGAARRPELTLDAESLTVAGVSARQGRRSVIALAEECNGADRASIEGLEHPLIDVDGDPATMTLDTDLLALGTRAATVDCGQGQIAAFDLLVYRQTGSGGGGATSGALLGVGGLLALASALIRSPDELRR